MASATSQVYFDGYGMSHHFELVAGVRCLDFVNTVGDRTGQWQYVRNYLQRYEDVVAWGEQSSILTPPNAAQLRSLAAHHPHEADEALKRALNLREALHAVFEPVAAGQAIDRHALTSLDRVLRPVLSMSTLVAQPNAAPCHWEFHASAHAPDALDRVIWSVARSAADLLTSSDLAHVRQCALESCGWLFLDLSKNKSRRWCAMMLCGNRSKARRHRASRKHGNQERSEE
jgi:predicted RNA-binding Zn ribbon-like protein